MIEVFERSWNMAGGSLAFFNLPGGMEWVVILVVGLLLFGRRMPEVARSVGKSIVEFKKGIRDVRGDIDEQSKEDAEPCKPELSTKPAQEKSPTGV